MLEDSFPKILFSNIDFALKCMECHGGNYMGYRLCYNLEEEGTSKGSCVIIVFLRLGLTHAQCRNFPNQMLFWCPYDF